MFNLSKQERQVILFLAIASLAGAGIDYVRKNFSSSMAAAVLRKDMTKIDLNRADMPVLMRVRGIGEKIAGRIIEYRLKEGGFRDVEELRRIKGITGSKYEKIKDEFVIR
ncbi:MAG: helix-hairpin-helix domain-containing protein [Candidatus Omnitrophica bacterium]|nr:helix-hairpin-helix domain-containing protein [Candidatus Omnitrophota bacterium]